MKRLAGLLFTILREVLFEGRISSAQVHQALRHAPQGSNWSLEDLTPQKHTPWVSWYCSIVKVFVRIKPFWSHFQCHALCIHVRLSKRNYKGQLVCGGGTMYNRISPSTMPSNVVSSIRWLNQPTFVFKKPIKLLFNIYFKGAKYKQKKTVFNRISLKIQEK